MRLWRTGRLPWKTLRVSQPRAPLPTASKALTILIYLTNHNNIQGSGWGSGRRMSMFDLIPLILTISLREKGLPDMLKSVCMTSAA
jgi:hypothetical protein